MIKMCKSVTRALSPTLGLLALGQAHAAAVYFAAPDYVNGDLINHINWNKDNGNTVFVDEPGYDGSLGIVSLSSSGEYIEGIYSEALPMVGPNDSATIKLRFQYTSTGTLSSSQSGVIAAQFNETSSGGDIITLAVRRRNTNKIQLYGSNAGGANIFSAQVDETAAGITNITDTSHWLELTATLTRGNTTNDWLLGGTLTNLTLGGTHVVTLPDTEITPPFDIVNGNAVYGGINSRRTASDNMTTNRIVDTFEVVSNSETYMPLALVSYDTGYTISNVKTVQTVSNSFIIGSSYEGTLLAMDFAGTALWTNALSGFMNRDLWCDDLTGDGTDEILTANADGTIYCLDAEGSLLWQFKMNDAPMNSVCVVHDSSNTPYVVCGGYDLNIYYLSSTGNLVKTIASSTYSIDIAWSGILPPRPPDYIHTANFLRPIQINGTENLAVQGVLNTHQESGSIYLFEVLADLPFRSDDVFTKMRVGDFRAVDPDGDGTDEILMGASVNRPDGRIVRYDPLTGAQVEFNIYNTFNAECGPGYRVAQTEPIPDGEGSFQYLLLYGDNIMLVPPDLDPANSTILSTRYAFNDLCKDPVSGRIILASAQSGGSCIHLIDPLHADWKMDYENLTPPGKIATILANTASARNHLNTFTKPAWERKQTPIYMMTENTKGLESLAYSLTNTYDSLIFLNSHYELDVQSTEWRTAISNEVYRNKRDSRRNYILTQNEALNGTTGVEGLLEAFDGYPGMTTWGGHGNDPYFYEPSTLRATIDGATNSVTGGFKKTVLVWPEMNGSDTNFTYVMDNLFYPLADYASPRNANIYVRNKNLFWLASVYLPAWQRMVSGEFSDVFVPSMEETSDKTQDMTIAGRIGIWASGAVDSWGTRAVPDNASYDRLRQFSTQRLPNHFLRMLVYHLSSGAQYLNNYAVDQEYISIFWELLAKGALFVPKPHEIVSFNPVHLSMTEPDHEFVEHAENSKWTTYWDEAWEDSNKMVFNRMNGTWPGAPLTDWDFSRYASGVKERRLEFLPPYQNGMVMITPPQHGVFADTNAVRGKMADRLHPLYKNIMQEFITDGRNYISSDGTTTNAAETYYTTVSNAIASAASKLPLTVSGDVAWVCAQTSPTHLRLTLIDSGYINPKARIATVHFNTVTPVGITDLLDGTTYSPASTVKIDVPLGLFRFIDIELASPFFPENGWGDYASEHGLTGNPKADQDNDGELDIHEYAWAGNPTNPAIVGSKPSMVFQHNNVSLFTHQLNHTNPGITYVTEWSTSLVSNHWNSSWNMITNFSMGNADYTQTQYQLTGSTNDYLFFRLKITQP
ncbi:hypothetical protein [Pontiella agarivorans]|uniref:Lambda-carrageenase n=1 Tax=Pontiella agarivorans TaxID=3038953 RepID=A0ABU5N268_9BACT|nr:hypothetical protein [Pontiella agarivorans]MDZ8120539.1 hypothetical protein [Pontiella agarivorans]